MKGYAAEIDGCAIYLTKDSQIDEMLEKGCNIVRIEDDESMTTLATPEDGFFSERPSIEKKAKTMTNPYAEAMAVLLSEEN